ncbi:MAG: hypothetical protein UH625_00925 [Muribaculaceae bacterium]|nr:hypothetical protein [Muribaculaceae bacterium]
MLATAPFSGLAAEETVEQLLTQLDSLIACSDKITAAKEQRIAEIKKGTVETADHRGALLV